MKNTVPAALVISFLLLPGMAQAIVATSATSKTTVVSTHVASSTPEATSTPNAATLFATSTPPISPLPLATSTPIATSTQEATTTPEIKEVALTFDDGPYGTSTQKVLDILKKENVTATFFLIGKNVREYPQLAKEIVQDGDVVGNHTYDHSRNLTTMSWAKVKKELSKTDSAIVSTTGVHTKLFRPPYGNMTPKLQKKIESKGYTLVMWNVDPRDWDDASSTSETIVQSVLDNVKTHMVIVLHDGRDTHLGYDRDNMLGALPTIIADLKERGYTFVTIHPGSDVLKSVL